MRSRLALYAHRLPCLYGSSNKEWLFLYKALDYLVFITEAECVYCAVWIEYLNIIDIHLSLDMFQTALEVVFEVWQDGGSLLGSVRETNNSTNVEILNA
jgi:hypothetical protein